MKMPLWHHRIWLFLIVGLALIVCSTGACADDVPPGQGAIFNNEATQQAVVEFARQQNKQLPGACRSATYGAPSRPVFFSKPGTDATGGMTGGAWIQSVIATGCGTRVQLNTLTMVQSDGVLRRIALLPGNTIADPFLQRDGIMYARAGAAGLIPADCRQVLIVETRFVKYEGDAVASVRSGRMLRPWREDWAIDACGRRVAVMMHFVPDATGTTIVVHRNESRLVK